MPVESMRASSSGVKTRPDGKQFAAHGARFRVGLAGFHQGANEAGAQQHVGVERQYPFGRTGTDGAFCASAKPRFRPQWITRTRPRNWRSTAAVPSVDPLSTTTISIGTPSWRSYRFQTAPDVPRAVIRDDGCTDGWVGH